MRLFSLWCLIFVSVLSASTLKGVYVTEPVFNSSVYLQTSGNPKNKAVVLVHGLGDEASTIWEGTVALLEKEYYVVRFDLPGFGNSSKSNELYSPENYAKVIRFLTQTYLKRPFHLVGHSMGGAIALYYTHMYPLDVESLVLVDAAGILHPLAYSNFLTHRKVNHFFEEQGELFQGIQSQKLNRFIDRMSDKINAKMENMERVLNSPTLRESVLGGTPATIAAVALVQTSFNTIPQSVLQKTTIIWGKRDEIAPVQTGYVLDKLMPHSTLAILPEAAHVPMLSHEREFYAVLLAHLEGKMVATPPPKMGKDAYTIKVRHVSNQRYSGRIKNLVIYDSQKVVIENAIVENLSLFNAEVEILNSVIENKDAPLRVENSALSIVASDIVGSFKLYNSRLNLAGVKMQSRAKPIVAVTPSRVIYSLSEINAKRIHGKEILGR
ncbi:MAG: alpha/beta hydrolase [Campylobacterales bacterium]|nr:alpha/beta hydrolase [Campylobacterales bacterium]